MGPLTAPGACSLGANSLLDIVVFGRATAMHVAQNSKPGLPHKPLAANAGENSIANIDKARAVAPGAYPACVRAVR